MDEQTGAVARIILLAKGRQGDQFAIVELTDGRLSITRNGQLVVSAPFDASDMDGCVNEFLRRTGVNSTTPS